MTSTVRIRLLFVLVLLIVPTGLVAKKLVGVEPYPALLLPSFGPVLEHDSIVTFRQAEVVGREIDGTEVVLDPAMVMPAATGDGYATVFGSIFTDQPKVTAPDSTVWLRSQLARSYPDRRFSVVTIRWQTTNVDTRTGTYTVELSETYSVDFGTAS